MNVKDLNSWSGLDFDNDKTNYVSIVTSGFSEENIEVKNLLKGLEQLLGFRICCDNCEKSSAVQNLLTRGDFSLKVDKIHEQF